MDEKNIEIPHSLILEDRKSIRITGVSDIGSYDEDNINVYTARGEICIKGRELQLTELSIEKGIISAAGEIDSIIYSENKKKKNGVLERFFS